MMLEDITLTTADIKCIAQFRRLGDDMLRWKKSHIQAQRWREQFLICTAISRSRDHCYREGKDRWSRLDGSPLSQEDIKAIQLASPGQGSKVVGKAGDQFVVHEWFVDSSD